MNVLNNQLSSFFSEFGEGKTMVLSTEENHRVTSRMMSVVQISGVFYFQTDCNSRKYRQLTVNPFVSLCIDNIQIDGECRILGRPLDFPEFCGIYRKCFRGSFEAYSALSDERLISVSPTYIQRWLYREGKPYVERFLIEEEAYSLDPYLGR